MKKRKLFYCLFFMSLIWLACTNDEVVYPKPLSAMKITFPNKAFTKKAGACDYSFNVAEYVEVEKSNMAGGPCNVNLNYQGFNATLYLTYIPIDTGLQYHIENSRKLVYDHSIKADAIEEKQILYPANRVFGTAYKLIGNTASNYQFYVTDSTGHFIRGALYFNTKPNYDSLKPSIEFLMPDFDTLVSTLSWPENNTK